MANRLRLLHLSRSIARVPLRPVEHQRAFFRTSPPRLTDGVYSEITGMRTRTPFIEAFRKQQEGLTSSPQSSEGTAKLDVSPKTMSDSYHRVVSQTSRQASLLWEIPNLVLAVALGSGPLAIRFLYQCFGSYKARCIIYGSRRHGRCYRLQAHW